MSRVNLGNIVITDGTSYSTYSSGPPPDTIYVYYNDVTEAIEVELNSAIITSGDDLNTYDSSFYWADKYYPSIIDGDSVITFIHTDWWPYAVTSIVYSPPEVDPEESGEVNDIEISINLITPATGEVTADGSFIVTASGTNTPFTYSLTNFVSDSGQSSTTFSGLAPGTYTVTAKDSLGYKASAPVLVGYDIGYASSTFGIRWWYEEQNRAGVIFKIDILERDFAGSATEVVGKNPFVLTLRGEGSDIYSQGIIASSASISLNSTSTDQYKDISLGDDYKYKVNRYINTSTLQWTGYILPRTYQAEIRSLPYTTSFTATDGLGDLKSLDFHTEQDWKFGFKTSIRGRISQLEAFRICLSKLNLDQGFRIACNIFDTTHTSGIGTGLGGASYNQNYAISEDVNMRGLFFKPDGLKMYSCGIVNDEIYQYTLSSAWDISTASYDTVLLDISAKETAATDIYFKADGLKLYFVGSGNDKVYQYNLSVSWDLSTAVYNQDFSVSSEDVTPQGLFFKPDGLKMYMAGYAGSDINEYTLSSAWDISTLSFSQNKSLSSQDTEPRSVFFNSNGVKMYISGSQNDNVYEYDLSTAWDISTIVYNSVYKDISSQDNTPFQIYITATKLYFVGNTANDVFEYDLTATGTATNSPINQTQINSNVYTDYDVNTRIIDGELKSIEEPQYTTCEQVLTDILTIYKAILVNWEGYWYIIDQEELLNTTINYVEYDSVGAYVTTGSLTPQIAFNTAQSTSRWRWMGTQTASTTDIYRNLILNINLHLRDGGVLKNGVLKKFNTINILRAVVSDNPLGETGEEGSSLSGFYQDTVYQQITEETALNYLLFNDTIEYNGSDSVTLKVRSITRLTYGRRYTTEIPEAQAPPYLNMRWMLKVDGKYSSPYKKAGNLRVGISDTNWSTTETINNHYVTSFGKEDNFEFTLPFENVDTTTSNYVLRIYIPNLYDYDYEGATEFLMENAVRQILTAPLSVGHRIIARHLKGVGSDYYKYYYYELQQVKNGGYFESLHDDLELLKPANDYHGLKWRLIHSREYPSLDGDSMTETTFTELSLTQNPEGFDAPEEVQLTSVLNNKNKIDIEREVNIFDEYSVINNAKNIYDNHTTYTDGTPTSAWTKTGETVSKTIQEHLLLWDTQLLKQTRQRVSGAFTSDVQVTPLSVLKDSGSSNKIYYIQGLTLNDYTQEYSGEIIEIGSDDTPATSAFTTGFKQNALE